MPLALASGILFIYAEFFQAALTLITSNLVLNGRRYTSTNGSVIITVIFMVVIGYLALSILFSLYVAVTTDPGSVPLPLVYLYRGLLQRFRERQYTEPRIRRDLPPELYGLAGVEDSGESDGEDGEGKPLPARGASLHDGGGVAGGVASPISLPLGGELVCEQVENIPETLFTRPGPHDPRYCRKSGDIKPPRAHFCSTCDRLVLKMDHHWCVTKTTPFFLFPSTCTRIALNSNAPRDFPLL